MSLTDRYNAFAQVAPPDVFGDPIWKLPAYRIGRFLADIADEDAARLTVDDFGAQVIVQMQRAAASIPANIAEGCSRFSSRDRARYFELALGSAREAREWIRRLIPALGPAAALERAELLTRVIKILNVAIPQERDGASERRIRRRASSPSTSPSPSPSPQTSTPQPVPAISNPEPADPPALSPPHPAVP